MDSTGAIKSLTVLLASLTATLHPKTFVFATVPCSQAPLYSLQVQMSFCETEGTTLILEKTSAELLSLDFVYPCKMITLNVHSSLEAVGFMAAITARLQAKCIAVNPVSGFFHDHLFVAEGKEMEALEELELLAVDAKKGLYEKPEGG